VISSYGSVTYTVTNTITSFRATVLFRFRYIHTNYLAIQEPTFQSAFLPFLTLSYFCPRRRNREGMGHGVESNGSPAVGGNYRNMSILNRHYWWT
jgi:hypothetical protein